MAVSGTISTTTFNTQRVIDTAVRRCRLPVQAITSEMQQYARDALYLILSDLANYKTPSWCIEKQLYPFYLNQPIVTLDVGTVTVLNANYRTTLQISGTVVSSANEYKVQFDSQTQVATIGIKWSADVVAIPLTFQVSNDNISWITVGTETITATAGTKNWFDIAQPLAYSFFRITSTSTITYDDIYLGNTPTEIPFGVLNRDAYVNQSNKIFAGRPTTYWLKRDRLRPEMYLWPAPDSTAETAQLVVWRHRNIMDVGTLTQEIEVPQRWLEAITARLAAKMAMETPAADAGLIPMLQQMAQIAQQAAWDGDNDGSPMFIQPWIAPYTK
jgi:hypothetical protein